MYLRIFRALRPFLFAFALILSGTTNLLAQNHGSVAALVRGLELMRAGDWEAALPAAGPDGSVARDILEWHRLRDSQGTFQQTRRFLARRADWPGLKLLRKRSEVTIPAGADPREVIAFFTAQPPQTGSGALRMAQALAATGAKSEAEAQVVFAWFSLSLSAEEEGKILAEYGPALEPYHWQRLDMLLWRGMRSEAQRMLQRVSPDHRALAEARLALRKKQNGVDTLIAAIPDALSDDPGLAYERFLWRASKGRNQGAIDLILARSSSVASLGDAHRWSSWRRVLARWSMRQGDARQAYRLASRHQLTGGKDFNDLEWLAGFIALRKLDDPATALKHFQTFRQSVDTPISLGRAGYWLGRTHEALGNTQAAQSAYAFGGGFQTSFYGQLAAQKAGMRMDPALTGQETFPDWKNAAFWSSSTMQAARLLLAAQELYLTERFTVHLAESLNRSEIGQLTAWAEDQGAPHIQLMVAKQGARQGMVIVRPYFPTPDMGAADAHVPDEWPLAIARRESEFDPQVVSGVGAQGLMQLMPGTARDMAKRLEVEHSAPRLLSDPAYNAQLGTAYLAYLFEEFGDNPVLISAAYNAGPGRVRKWTARYGQPGSTNAQVVDWIEGIAFRETRNYVMRVIESLDIYRARLSTKTAPLQISMDLKGRN